MAAIVSTRIARLQAVSPRTTGGVDQSGVVASLTNSAVTLPANAFGVVTSYATATTKISVFHAAVDATALWSLSKSDSAGVASSISGNTITVSSLTADQAQVTITATRTGYDSQVKVFSLSRAKDGSNGTNGATGATGATGSTGTTGLNGAPGSNGARGSMTFYTSGSAWSDSVANSVITTTTGSSTRIIGDTVTISNATFAETKYWSGASWTPPGTILDGNLLVRGTVSADSVYGGTLGGAAIDIVSATYGSIFKCSPSSNTVEMWKVSCSNIASGSAGDPTAPAVKGWSSASGCGVHGYTSSASIDSHGVRGSRLSGTAGLVGSSVGYDFYAEGSGTNYGPFTGAHDCLFLPSSPVVQGDIVVDVCCKVRKNVSTTLFEVALSSTPNQKGVVGVFVHAQGLLVDSYPPAVFQNAGMQINDEGDEIQRGADLYYDLKSAFNLGTMNALGEGLVNVCGEGGDIAAGDLIVTSSTPGKGMKQADDVIRGYTVAKAREALTFNSPSEVKTIACIYVCG